MGMDSICILRESVGFEFKGSAMRYQDKTAMPTATRIDVIGLLNVCFAAVRRLMRVDCSMELCERLVCNVKSTSDALTSLETFKTCPGYEIYNDNATGLIESAFPLHIFERVLMVRGPWRTITRSKQEVFVIVIKPRNRHRPCISDKDMVKPLCSTIYMIRRPIHRHYAHSTGRASKSTGSLM